MRIARRLNAAYAGGLLSADTFAARIDEVLESRLVDPAALVGDLNLRPRPGRRHGLMAPVRKLLARVLDGPSPDTPDPPLLALDWSGGHTELLIGRHLCCDIVVDDLTVSRQHARLVFRDGKWIIRDLCSTNGTLVNEERVGRSELRPGDHVTLGEHRLKVD
jgi:hypothetical protein